MRTFNTSGPNILAEHYTLPRLDWVEKGKKLVCNNRYFIIEEPPETGKSTYLRFLAETLGTEGYNVCTLDFKNFEDKSANDCFIYFKNTLHKQWDILLESDTLNAVFKQIESINNQKCVLIIDTIDDMNTKFLSNLVHAIRSAFHSRERHCLKSVILVGVNHILDRVKNNVIPFNIADNLNIPYFTDEETAELLNQHERETGQLFDPSVKNKISYITANQPGLVNAFAYQLVEDYPEKPVIEYADYLVVEDWFLTEALDKHVGNIFSKAEDYRDFVELLLFKDVKIRFQIYREEIRALFVNGVIAKDEDGFVRFRVPLYQKCLYAAFYPYMNGESERIGGSIIVEDYFNEDNSLNIDKIIEKYKEYALRRSFKYFREKSKNGKYLLTLKEATLVYSFETYLNAFLAIVEGKSYLEAHTALGRTDLLINVNNQEFVIEAKIYNNITLFKKGKKQLAYYAKNLSLDSAIYLVFVESEITNPNITEKPETIDGVLIKTYLVPYNLEKDF